jgi:anti-sigma regulatory factor (Ser/Thr protein kinase)
MGATTSTAAGGIRAGDPRTATTDTPQAPAPTASVPVIVGSMTIAGQTKNVAEARAFVGRTLGEAHPCADEAVLLCSELVTNAVLHSESGQPGGTVTVVVLAFAGAVRVEVVDNGSVRSTPVVKAEVFEPDGHGLFLVEQLADNWGYTRDSVGTTVWFRLTC